MAADDWGKLMTARIRAAIAAAPTVDKLRPVLEDAARAGALAAQARRQPAAAQIRPTATGLQLVFRGPGARQADAVARARLASTLPAAVEGLRAESVRRLRS